MTTRLAESFGSLLALPRSLGRMRPRRARHGHRNAGSDQAMQISLMQRYRELLHLNLPLPALHDVQFRAYSQTTEDGLLLYIFSLIGATTRKTVEICAGTGIECNTANLIINHGWHGLLVDGDERNVEIGRDFYRRCPDTPIWPPDFQQAWITADSVDALVRGRGFAGEIDLLSLDIDGNDYWIWQALECVRPRVVIAEYQNSWGPTRRMTQEYQPDFVFREAATGLSICGASLPALVQLGRRKGYRLVGCNRLCFNAVFLRDDVGVDILPTILADECFHHPMAQFNVQRLQAHERAGTLHGRWIEV